MNYPHGRCEACGERPFGHVDGGNVCLNCGMRYPDDGSGDGGGGGTKNDADRATIPAA